MRKFVVGALIAVISTAFPGGSPAAQRAVPELLWLSNLNTKTLQRELQAAADRGYRVIPLPTGYISDFYFRAVLLEKTIPEPEPVEYLIVPKGLRDIDKAAGKGFRLVGFFTGVVVMQRRNGTTERTHEYAISATRLKRSMENELLVHAAKGFRVVGLVTSPVVGILRPVDMELVAVLERPVHASEAVRPDYLILYSLKVDTTRSELQAAADRGYRLLPLQGGWGSTVLVEKAGDVEPVEYVVMSTTSTATMQMEMDKASLEGYRFSCTLGSGLREFVVVMQRPKGARARTHEQVLLAASRYKTLEGELLPQLAKGFRPVGFTSVNSAARVYGALIGHGPEGVAILERPVP